MTSLRGVWIDDIGGFKAVADKWDAALGRSGEESPFLLSDFVVTWWKHYSKGRSLKIFALYKEEEMVGGLPLCSERRYLRRLMTYPGLSAANLTQCFVADKGVNLFKELISILEREGLERTIMLERVLSGHPMLKDVEAAFSSLDPARFSYRVFNNGFNGVIDLREGYEAVTKRLNNRLRRYIKRGKDALRARGELILERIRGAGEVAGLFRDYKKLSIASFRSRGGASAFEADPYANFFEEFIKNLEDKGMLDAHRLKAGKETLGISFGYRFGKGFKWILTAFNTDFQELRPGHLLIDALVKEAIERGDPYFDMYYGGESFYKQQWCSEMVPIKKIEIFNNNIVERSVTAAENFIRSNNAVMKSMRGIKNFCANKIKSV